MLPGMQRLLLLATLLATTPVHAATWEASFRKCDIGKSFAKADTLQPPDGSSVFVTITPADIPALERGIKVLKQCRKFWACVERRTAGKVKHCYMPR
jgi:hypothetical protein